MLRDPLDDAVVLSSDSLQPRQILELDMQRRLVELVGGDRTHHGDKVVVGNNTDFGVAHATESVKSLRR
jgi:hypothetical protein